MGRVFAIGQVGAASVDSKVISPMKSIDLDAAEEHGDRTRMILRTYHRASKPAIYTKGTGELTTANTGQLYPRLRERLSEPAMLGLTKRLIAIPPENPPGNRYDECAGILFEELDRLGFDDVRREGACVLASAGAGPRTLYFSGHYDVVPAQSRDQFQPRAEGANLFGRGSSDMKAAWQR
jgi:Peptidase family M20/M25/M40